MLNATYSYMNKMWSYVCEYWISDHYCMTMCSPVIKRKRLMLSVHINYCCHQSQLASHWRYLADGTNIRTSLNWARPLPAVLWPFLPSNFISYLIPKASLSLSTPSAFTTSTPYPLHPLYCCLSPFRLTCKGVLTASITTVPVLESPSSSGPPLTQRVLLAFTELTDDEGMKRIKNRDLKLRTWEEHLVYFMETQWKTRLYS